MNRENASSGWLTLLLAAMLAACTSAPASQPAATDTRTSVPAMPHDAAQAMIAAAARVDLGQPYLGGPLPGGERLIRPAPVDGDARSKADLAANAGALLLRGSPRWRLAERDADLGPGWYDHAFSCTAGVAIDASSAPAVAKIIRRAASDFGSSTGAVKKQFMRPRPFAVNGKESCTPGDEPYLRGNGSYPSGHSAIGFGTGLVLASIFPDKAADFVARGRGYGDSRWICNVHWQSDVEEARAFGAATFARLQSDPQFRADLAAARDEASALLIPPDPQHCALEDAAEATG